MAARKPERFGGEAILRQLRRRAKSAGRCRRIMAARKQARDRPLLLDTHWLQGRQSATAERRNSTATAGYWLTARTETRAIRRRGDTAAAATESQVRWPLLLNDGCMETRATRWKGDTAAAATRSKVRWPLLLNDGCMETRATRWRGDTAAASCDSAGRCC